MVDGVNIGILYYVDNFGYIVLEYQWCDGLMFCWEFFLVFFIVILLIGDWLFVFYEDRVFFVYMLVKCFYQYGFFVFEYVGYFIVCIYEMFVIDNSGRNGKL